MKSRCYPYRKNKKAFTLVELIVVIAIIAILGTVVGVSVTSFVKSAKKRSVESTASSLVSVWDMFVANADGRTLNAFIKENFPNNNKEGFAIWTSFDTTLKAQDASTKTGTFMVITRDKWECLVTAKSGKATKDTGKNSTAHTDQGNQIK